MTWKSPLSFRSRCRRLGPTTSGKRSTRRRRKPAPSEVFSFRKPTRRARRASCSSIPFTIAAGLYVGNLIVSSAAGAAIGLALEKLIAKMRADSGVASTGTIVVLMPDLSVIKLDPHDRRALTRLSAGYSKKLE